MEEEDSEQAGISCNLNSHDSSIQVAPSVPTSPGTRKISNQLRPTTRRARRNEVQWMPHQCPWGNCDKLYQKPTYLWTHINAKHIAPFVEEKKGRGTCHYYRRKVYIFTQFTHSRIHLHIYIYTYLYKYIYIYITYQTNTSFIFSKENIQ